MPPLVRVPPITGTMVRIAMSTTSPYGEPSFRTGDSLASHAEDRHMPTRSPIGCRAAAPPSVSPAKRRHIARPSTKPIVWVVTLLIPALLGGTSGAVAVLAAQPPSASGMVRPDTRSATDPGGTGTGTTGPAVDAVGGAPAPAEAPPVDDPAASAAD